MNSANSRAQAMLHVAMFEAVNAIDKRYTPYKLNLAADPRHVTRSSCGCRRRMTCSLRSTRTRRRTSMRRWRRRLSAIADGEAKSKGIELGKKAAAEIIALRANDGSGAPESYRPQTSPGVYVPTIVPGRVDRGANHAVGDAHGLAVPARGAAGAHLGCLDQ